MTLRGGWLHLLGVLSWLLVVISPITVFTPPAVQAHSNLFWGQTSNVSQKNTVSKKAEFEPGQLLVKFSSDEPSLRHALAKPVYAAVGVSHIQLEIPQAHLYRLFVAPATDLNKLIRQLEAEPGVVFAQPDYIYHLFDLHNVNDPYRASQYYLDKTSIQAAWNLTTGSNVTIAVEDSGVRLDHPDLRGRIRSDGFNFVADNGDVNDDLGHGTEVAGIIAANSNNGQGIAGINWKAQILPVKVADAAGSIDADVAAKGIYYAVAHGARILNLSYGGEFSSSALADAVTYALDNQVIVVAAGGNSPDGAPEFPAAYRGVIAVASTDEADRLSFFNSYGSYIALSAPGQDIYTTALNKDGSGDYSPHSGTSFSAPIVSGVAALMLSLNPYLRPGQVFIALTQTTDKIYPSDQDYYASYGTGRLNAYRALQAVSNLPVLPLLPQAQAQIVFSQNLNPNATVTLGSNLNLNVTATNVGKARAQLAYLTVPIAPQLDLLYVQTPPNVGNVWVTEVFSDHFNIQLGALDPTADLTFTAVYRVKRDVTLDTNISWQSTGFWKDSGAGGSGLTNRVSVRVGTVSSSRPTNFALLVTSPPTGKIGQDFAIESDDFAAGEMVSIWLNLPDGSIRALSPALVDRRGRLEYLFDSSGQKQTGDYSLVAHGQTSQVELVARFRLEP